MPQMSNMEAMPRRIARRIGVMTFFFIESCVFYVLELSLCHTSMYDNAKVDIKIGKHKRKVRKIKETLNIYF